MIGNLGDSRAVLAMRDKDRSLVAVQLTVDLKPDLPSKPSSLYYAKMHKFVCPFGQVAHYCALDVNFNYVWER